MTRADIAQYIAQIARELGINDGLGKKVTVSIFSSRTLRTARSDAAGISRQSAQKRWSARVATPTSSDSGATQRPEQ